MRIQGVRILFLVAATMMGSGAAADVAEKHRLTYQEAVADPNNPAKVDAYIATLVEAPAGSGRYIVEGDYLLSRGEIQSYLKSLRNPSPNRVASEELIVNVFGGQFDYIVDAAKRRMHYVVDAASFRTPQNAELVRSRFKQAAQDWEAACRECGIQFIELTTAQAGSNPRPSFVVRYQNVASGPIARAFFPSSPPDDRVVMIFPGYFAPDMGFDAVGVLRHEIGHILGYRHEHIGNIPGCYTEGSEWKPLTPYTPNSVMHYFCGGRGSFDLRIRQADEKGHRCLYMTGKPCPRTQ